MRGDDYNLRVSEAPVARVPRLVTGRWDVLGAAARAVREAVFIVEQAIPRELEWDEWDAESLHALAFDAHDRPIGTGRLLPAAFDAAHPGVAHIGRMAVLGGERRAGTGGAILLTLMHAARAAGFHAAQLNAQTYVAAFYARHGFVAEGPEFDEVGIPHVSMRASLAGMAAR